MKITQLQLAQREWEAKTTRHPKEHPVDKNGKVIHLHEFRKYGQAIALINWGGEYIEITKLEKLPGSSRGAAVPLVEFLQALAEHHHVHISGQAVSYIPDPPIPEGPFPSQEQLELWYKKLGFQLSTQGKPAPTWIWYPDVPPRFGR